MMWEREGKGGVLLSFGVDIRNGISQKQIKIVQLKTRIHFHDKKCFKIY